MKQKTMIIMVFCLLLNAINACGQGDLLINPMRIVFDGTKQHIQELTLANIGKDTAEYAISFSHLRMNVDGSFAEITKPDSGQFFSDQFIRFFPRIVKLGPNESQVVKFQLTHIRDLKEGEYRSHIYIRAVPNMRHELDSLKNLPQTKTVSVKLIAVFGISIPVIVLPGVQNVKVALTNLSISETDKKPYLNITFNRKGNVSCYGHLSLVYTAPGGKSISLQSYKGIAVYSPNLVRTAKYPIETKKGLDLHTGKLQVTYRAAEEKNNVILAQANLDLH